MEYKNYFWDFDGTLYNSYPGMVRAFVETLKTQEIELDSKEVYKIMREASVRKAFKLYGENLDIPKLRQMYHSFEEQYQDKMRLFDGAADVCRKIKENGGRNFLLTHRDSSALNILKSDNLWSYFDDFVTADNDFARKPDPESLLYLVNKYNLKVEESVMVGDRELDIAAGHNAGMSGILFDPDKLLHQDYNADRLVYSLSDILK